MKLQVDETKLDEFDRMESQFYFDETSFDEIDKRWAYQYVYFEDEDKAMRFHMHPFYSFRGAWDGRVVYSDPTIIVLSSTPDEPILWDLLYFNKISKRLVKFILRKIFRKTEFEEGYPDLVAYRNKYLNQP